MQQQSYIEVKSWYYSALLPYGIHWPTKFKQFSIPGSTLVIHWGSKSSDTRLITFQQDFFCYDWYNWLSACQIIQKFVNTSWIHYKNWVKFVQAAKMMRYTAKWKKFSHTPKAQRELVHLCQMLCYSTLNEFFLCQLISLMLVKAIPWQYHVH